MKCGTCCFKFKGIYYAFGTKLKLTEEAYKARPDRKYGTEYTFIENHETLQLLICMGEDKNGKSVSTLIPYHYIKDITVPNYFGGITTHTQKLIDEQAKEKETEQIGPLTTKIVEKEKKAQEFKVDIEENFNAWVLYILAMLVATIFKANIFLWLIITLYFSIYKTYEHK